ncbi:prepilin-type N-terminal cleavage/methylation domain-containing protein [Rubritalea spongiae]|uniref:Prepilin-type N-terminal cleavage/methylation domain-containing protein n=1 Tax=Rubritalea spongiae TaxID=430797 RepID=A0ABW5E3B2_9BACT
MKILKQQARVRGFSMVEVLAVMVILAILGSIGFGTYMLVNRNARVTQAELMIENLSTSLENRVNERFTGDSLDALEASGILDGDSQYPSGDGSDGSSQNLYAFLSGDFKANGSYDAGEIEPAFPEMDPNYQGKGKYLNDDLEIIDPWRTPIRYKFHIDGEDLNNNVEGGFDIWSAGPDLEFDTEDDIKNW